MDPQGFDNGAAPTLRRVDFFENGSTALNHENEGLDMFDIELQKKFTDASLTVRTQHVYRQPESSQASKDISLHGTEMSSVADELCVSELIQNRERSRELFKQLAQLVRQHCESAVGALKLSVDASGSTAPGNDKEFEENVALVANVVTQVTRNHSLTKSSKSKGQPITVSLLQMHNKLTSNPPLRYGGATNPSTASDDRNTIDTEVSDSLYRLRAIGPRNNAGKSSRMKGEKEVGGTIVTRSEVTPNQSTVDFIRRPANPYDGCPRGSFTTPGQAPQTVMQVWRMNPEATKQLGSNSRETTATLYPFTSASATGVDAVECPQPVKPSNVEKRQLSSRGPLNKTGKNICPSNYSAFSECSGGESRSVNSAELRTSVTLNLHSTT